MHQIENKIRYAILYSILSIIIGIFACFLFGRIIFMMLGDNINLDSVDRLFLWWILWIALLWFLYWYKTNTLHIWTYTISCLFPWICAILFFIFIPIIAFPPFLIKTLPIGALFIYFSLRWMYWLLQKSNRCLYSPEILLISTITTLISIPLICFLLIVTGVGFV